MMRNLTLIALCLVLTLSAFAQQGKNKKAANNTAKFIGKWKGDEKCADVSAPVALLFIQADTAQQILLSGIYSIQGSIIGKVQADTIFIPKQEAVDPNYTNLFIEGKLVFGFNPFSLSGVIKVLNNQKHDECAVKYYK